MSTDPDWGAVDALFEAALDLPVAKRSAFLDEECANEAHRKRVEELLKAAADSDSVLPGGLDVARGLANALREDLDTAPGAESDGSAGQDARIGERLGSYRITQRIGQGGMGTVYLAERADGSFQQEVAIKVIRRGLESPEVAGRLEMEREILSSLQHAHIARLLDGGETPDGLPYLVMEPVHGMPLTEYLDDGRFSVRARLRLLLDVCDAVAYAHRNLVVHRDLKPSNILVTEDGRVMLLDFGIAKVLGDGSHGTDVTLTQTGHVVLTPEYSSPEQVRRETITTASDVYQLGVLLYRVLTGVHPYSVQGLSPARLESVIAETQPERPSEALDRAGADASDAAQARQTSPDRLKRTLKGDLDTVVLKALRKEPERRYASAGDLARDLRLYLAGRPVSAQPDRWTYRTGKFLGRNPWVAPVAAVVTTLVVGYGYTLVQHAAELEVERDIARVEVERTQEVQSFLVDLFRSADPYSSPDPEGSSELTVVQALDLGAERAARELSGRPEVRSALLTTIAEAYVNLDQMSKAEALQEQVFAADASHFGTESEEAAVGLATLAKIVARSGRNDSASVLYAEALPLTERVFGSEHPATGSVLADLGWLQYRLQSLEVAVVQLSRAADLLEDTGPEWRQSRTDALTVLSDAHRERGELVEARAAGERVLALTTEWHGADHIQTLSPRNVVASVLVEEGDYPSAEVLFRQNADLAERELGEEHEATIAALNNLARALGRQGSLDEAEGIYRRMVAIAVEKWGDVHMATADLKQNLSTALVAQEKFDEALQLLGEAYATRKVVLEPGHYLVAYPLVTRSAIELQKGDYGAARTTTEEAVGILRAGLPEGHVATTVAECRLGRALAGLGRDSEALTWLAPAVERMLPNPQAAANLKSECGEALVQIYESTGEATRAEELRGLMATAAEGGAS